MAKSGRIDRAERHHSRHADRRNSEGKQRRIGAGRGQRHKGMGLIPDPCFSKGRTYIPHECGIVRPAGGVLCLSAQKEIRGGAVPPPPPK